MVRPEQAEGHFGWREAHCPSRLGFGRLGQEFDRSRGCQVIYRGGFCRALGIDRLGSTEDKLLRDGVGRAGFWGVDGPGIDENEGGCECSDER